MAVPRFLSTVLGLSNLGLHSLAGFPIILVISAAGCVLGSLLTRPDDLETLKRFYRTVRPWGLWGPVKEAVLTDVSNFRPNTNFGRDMFNCAVAMIWQVPSWAIPVYAVFRDWKGLWICILVLIATSIILKYNWADKLPADGGA